jgi:hypothetical protein
MRVRLAFAGLVTVGIVASGACAFDRAYRQDAVDPGPPICVLGERRCSGARLETCVRGLDGRPGYGLETDCAATGLACASPALGCRTCVPGSTTCGGDRQDRVDTCRADGSGYDPGPLCEGQGRACRFGICDDLCLVARSRRSNVGCEYWAVQLDNARISASSNATAQQYAVVVSNPQPDVAADVVVEQDDAAPGEEAKIRVVAKARILPRNLEVFLLGPRWVDGSTDVSGTGETHTALTRGAYRITSDVPIIAYQFNPLENVNVFSNDASLLKPVEAIGSNVSYVVVGWPQTIARDPDPSRDFALDLRAFLTIVGTRATTTVKIRSSTAIVGGGGIPAVAAGETFERVLGPFEVLNLETGGFQADFTGTTIESTEPVVVFSGSEASDAPAWRDLSSRSCCADHLEEQLDPARTAGRRFVVARAPNRSRAIIAAGATGIGPFDEPQYVRIVAVSGGRTRVRTTLPRDGQLDSFVLDGVGAFKELEVREDLAIETDGAVHVGVVQASQEAAGIPRGLPGGDPSLLMVPPAEQFRSEYVFLTPDKYAFDFVTIMAPRGTRLLFDGAPFDDDACVRSFVAPAPSPITGAVLGEGYEILNCQLSFPVIDPRAPAARQILPGRQNDGVHRLQADRPVGLVVYGFDAFVSYAYAGGTELETLSPR